MANLQAFVRPDFYSGAEFPRAEVRISKSVSTGVGNVLLTLWPRGIMRPRD